MLRYILLILTLVRKAVIQSALLENDIECPIYMPESTNFYQSIERTRGNVVLKMIKWLSTLVLPQ